MSKVRSAHARSDVVTHWKWTLVFCGAAALLLAACYVACPTYDDADDVCIICASRRVSSHVSSMFGAFRWNDQSRIEESMLVTDGPVPSGHEHEWAIVTSTSRHLGRCAIGCGHPSVRPFAWWYSTDAEFRRAVSDRVAAGTLTREQIGRAMELPAPRSPYGGRPPIEELIAQFAPK